MWIKELDPLSPGSSNSRPLRFSLYGLPGTKVVSFDNGETTPKVPRLIIMIIATLHTCEKFFEVNVFVEDNVSPNRARDGIRHGVSLHKIDDSICSFFGSIDLSQFPRLFKMTVTLCRNEIILQMRSFGKYSWRYGRWLWLNEIEDFGKILQTDRRACSRMA
jgi:hypothetical protein